MRNEQDALQNAAPEDKVTEEAVTQESTAVTEQTLEDEKAIHEEMEALAALFQEELDRTKAEAAADAAADDEEPSDQTEEDDEENDDEDDAKSTLCVCCGEKKSGTPENPNSPYCADCDAGLRRYPFDFLNVLLAILLIAFVFVGGYFFASHMSVYTTILKGDEYLRQDRLLSAIDTYTTATDEMQKKHITGELFFKKNLLTIYKLGEPSVMLPTVQDRMKGFELGLPHMRPLKDAVDKSENYIAAIDACNALLDRYNEKKPEEMPYTQLISEMEALKGKPATLAGKQEKDSSKVYVPKNVIYEPAVVSYFQYYLALYVGQPISVQIQFLETARQEDPQSLWLYSYELGTLYAQTGHDVEPLCEEMTKLNVEDDTPALLRVIAKRVAKNPEEALTLAESKIREGSFASSEFLRQQALCYLALGKYEDAYQKASVAFEMDNTMPIINTYALTCLAAKKDKEYTDFVSTLSQNQIYLSSEVSDFKEGKITLEAILEEGDCDLT